MNLLSATTILAASLLMFEGSRRPIGELVSTKKIKLTVEYCGKAFSGWQLQDGTLTVQGELERALVVYCKSLAKKCGMEEPGRISLTGSGRTDAGVHALGQVASFEWPEQLPFDGWQLTTALNGITIPQLVVHRAELVAADFDARHTPHVKCYRYLVLQRGRPEGLLAGRVWRVGREIDVESMVLAARVLCGRHDFQSFRAQDCGAASTVRTLLLSELTRVDRETLCYTVYGRGFLKQMIRIIVGTLVKIGRDRAQLRKSGRVAELSGAEEMKQLLAVRNRTIVGETAPACGLYLDWVRYEDLSTDNSEDTYSDEDD